MAGAYTSPITAPFSFPSFPLMTMIWRLIASPAEEYADGYPVEGPFVEDDIFAIAGEETDQAEYDDEYDELYDEYEDEFNEAEAAPRRLTWPRLLFGCLGILLCIGLFYGF